MVVEVYEDLEDGSYTAVDIDNPDKKVLIGNNPKLLTTIVGDDWTDCMTKYYEFMDWGKYIPM